MEIATSYGGILNQPGRQAWYRFNSRYAPQVIFKLLGTTPGCAVRAVVLDGHERRLGELIASTRESSPFLVRLPASGPETYYLRIDKDPYESCKSAGYSASLVEPDQQECHPAPGAGCEGAPPFESPACDRAGLALDRTTVTLARDRSQVRRHLVSAATLRSLEASERAERRSARVSCSF
jgi:hypothetical protein